jgi:hypothetical protein
MAGRGRNRVDIGRSGGMGGESAGSKARNSWPAMKGFGLSDKVDRTQPPATRSRRILKRPGGLGSAQWTSRCRLVGGIKKFLSCACFAPPMFKKPNNFFPISRNNLTPSRSRDTLPPERETPCFLLTLLCQSKEEEEEDDSLQDSVGWDSVVCFARATS